jgi:hypothetical protein
MKRRAREASETANALVGDRLERPLVELGHHLGEPGPDAPAIGLEGREGIDGEHRAIGAETERAELFALEALARAEIDITPARRERRDPAMDDRPGFAAHDHVEADRPLDLAAAVAAEPRLRIARPALVEERRALLRERRAPRRRAGGRVDLGAEGVRPFDERESDPAARRDDEHLVAGPHTSHLREHVARDEAGPGEARRREEVEPLGQRREPPTRHDDPPRDRTVGCARDGDDAIADREIRHAGPDRRDDPREIEAQPAALGGAIGRAAGRPPPEAEPREHVEARQGSRAHLDPDLVCGERAPPARDEGDRSAPLASGLHGAEVAFAGDRARWGSRVPRARLRSGARDSCRRLVDRHESRDLRAGARHAELTLETDSSDERREPGEIRVAEGAARVEESTLHRRRDTRPSLRRYCRRNRPLFKGRFINRRHRRSNRIAGC